MKGRPAAAALAARRDFAVASTRRSWRGRVRQSVPEFLVGLAPALTLTVVFARVFAAVFETRLARHRGWLQDARQQHPRARERQGEHYTAAR
jgi:hypothetical protein